MTEARSRVMHELKTHTKPFEAVHVGAKKFEYRKDDRGPRFEVGDLLRLREWSPDELHLMPESAVSSSYSGREMLVLVTYLLRGPWFGIPEGYVCMSIEAPVKP